MRIITLPCLIICVILLCGAPIRARTTPVDPVAAQASLGHAALKGVTLKLMQGVYSFGVFTVGVGVGTTLGAAMAVADSAGAYVIYVGNEYLWDTYRPNTNLRANKEGFGALNSLSRTTLKYITFKPAVTAWHWGLIYSVTGSIQTTVLAGSVLWFTLPLMFYVNDTAWNFYDWRFAQGAPPAK